MSRHALAIAAPRGRSRASRKDVDALRVALTAPEPFVPPALLLDAGGWELQDALARHSAAVPAVARQLAALAPCLVARAPREILDAGAGAGRLIGPLLAAASAAGLAPHCTLAIPNELLLLERMFDLQQDHPGLPVAGLVGDLSREPALLGPAGRQRLITMVGAVMFDGLSVAEAAAYLRDLRSRLSRSDALVVTVGLVGDRGGDASAPAARLHEEWTRHALATVNQNFGADFPRDAFVGAWRHDARGRRRLLVLRALRPTTVVVREADLRLYFAAGRHLVLRSLPLFSRGGLERLARSAGFVLEQWRPAPAAGVAVALLGPARSVEAGLRPARAGRSPAPTT